MPRSAVLLFLSISQLLVTEADDWEDEHRNGGSLGRVQGRLCTTSCLPGSEAERVVDASYFLQLGLNLALRPARSTSNREPGQQASGHSPPTSPEATAQATGLAEVHLLPSVGPKHAAVAEAPAAVAPVVANHSQSKKVIARVGGSHTQHPAAKAREAGASGKVAPARLRSAEASHGLRLPAATVLRLAAPNDTNVSNTSNVTDDTNLTNVTNVSNVTNITNVTDIVNVTNKTLEAQAEDFGQNLTNSSTNRSDTNRTEAQDQANVTNITGNATEANQTKADAGRNTSLEGYNSTDTSSGIARELEGRTNSVGMTPALRKRTLTSSIIFLLIMLFVIGSLIFLVLLRRAEQP